MAVSHARKVMRFEHSIADDDIWIMTDNTLISACTGDMGNQGFKVTTHCWNLVGSNELNIKFILHTVWRQYSIDAFFFRGSFSVRSGKKHLL